MKKTILYSILVLMILAVGLVWAGDGSVDGYIERFAYSGYNRYIQVNGNKYLVNRKTRIEVLKGKELLVKNTRGYLKVGTKIKTWISSVKGEAWAKIIKINATASPEPQKPGQMKVPVVTPKATK